MRKSSTVRRSDLEFALRMAEMLMSEHVNRDSLNRAEIFYYDQVITLIQTLDREAGDRAPKAIV